MGSDPDALHTHRWPNVWWVAFSLRGEAPWCVACHPPSMSTGAFIQLYYAHYTRQCQPALITYAALARASASCCQNTTTENENISTFFDKAKGTHVHVLFSPLHGHRHLPHDDVVKTVLQQLRRRLQVAAQARVCRSPQAPPSTATQATRHSAPRLHTFICRSVPFSSSVNITSDSVLVATQGTHRLAHGESGQDTKATTTTTVVHVRL